jgi:hypothetical protein
MTNEELLARAEKAEAELAEVKAQAQIVVKEFADQQEVSYRNLLAAAAKIKQLEGELKAALAAARPS